MRLRLRRRAEAADAGISLIEMLVSMALLLVVLAILMTATVTALRNESGVNARAQNTTTATAALNKSTHLLREAVLLNADATAAFTAASASSVTFTTQVGTIASGATTVSKGPMTVTLSLGNNTACPAPDYCLIESDTPSISGKDSDGNTAWVPGSATTTRVLVHYVDPAASQQLFTFYQTTSTPTGNPAAPTLTTTPLTLNADGTLPSDQLDNVSMVDVYIAVKNKATTTVPSTTVESRVYLPNVSSYAVPAATT